MLKKREIHLYFYCNQIGTSYIIF